jgi:hypothetical protein
MRKTLLAALVALVITSAATAAPEKGKPPVSGVGCKPNVAVILTGTLTADGTASPLSVHVTGGNQAAKPYKTPAAVSVTIAPTTKISRQGHHLATDLKNGDRVNIQAKACKTALANNATPLLTATRVTAHPASS